MLEIMIAITIFSIAVVVLLELSSNGLKIAKDTYTYANMIIFAYSKLSELQYGIHENNNKTNGFVWQIKTSALNKNMKKIVLETSTNNHKRKIQLYGIELVKTTHVDKKHKDINKNNRANP
jgi:Tfp pilus assembly protein PilV